MQPAEVTPVLGLVRIALADRPSPEELVVPEMMERRTRYARGVEAIARAFGVTEQLAWEGEAITIGIQGDQVGKRAWQFALALWERARLELAMPARIAACVGETHAPENPGPLVGPGAEACVRLEGLAPPGAVVVSEDVYLTLGEAERAELALAGVVSATDIPAYVFPAAAAQAIDRAAIVPDEALRLWASLRAYAQSPEVRKLRYVGLRLHRREPPTLDVLDVFEPLRVEPLQRDRSAAQECGAVPFRGAFQANRSLVLLGDPGAGKTTLLRWLAVVTAGGATALHAALGVSERRLPLLVSVGRLAEIRRRLGAETPALEVLIHHLSDIRAAAESDLRASLPRALDAGQCMVLLDGLDEVHADERADIRGWIEAFAATYPRNRFIASSRRVGYAGITLPGGSEWSLLPFDDAQVERYAHDFLGRYVAWERGREDDTEATRVSASLLEAIHGDQRLTGLARNPFVLSALVLVYIAEGRLPLHRVQLYERFTRALWETWARARRLVVSINPGEPELDYEQEALPVLGRLALAMHEEHPTGVAPEGFVLEKLEAAMHDLDRAGSEEAQRTAREFLREAAEDVQILVERGAGAWSFLHLTLQEYLAAVGLHAEERFEEVALQHLFDPRWEEVLRLGVGYLALVQKRPLGARRFIDRVLSANPMDEGADVPEILEERLHLARRLMDEAGDAMPRAWQEDILARFDAWKLRRAYGP